MKAFIIHQGSKKKLRIKKEFVIGRMDGDRTYPNDGRMSRSHCILRFDGDVLTVEDLGSKNGTQIAEMNIDARTPVELVEGDILTVGDQFFEIMFKGKAKTSSAQAGGQEGDATEILEAAPGEEYASQHDPSLDMTEPPTIKAPELNFGSQGDDLSRTEVVPENMDRTVVDSDPNISFGKTGNSEFVNHPDLPKPDDERSYGSSSNSLPGDQSGQGKSSGLNPMKEATFDSLSFEQEDGRSLPDAEVEDAFDEPPPPKRLLRNRFKRVKPQPARLTMRVLTMKSGAVRPTFFPISFVD